MLFLAANECHGIMANFRWIISLTVQYNVHHLVLPLWQYPVPCITARSLDLARFNTLASYALVLTALQDAGGYAISRQK